VNSTKFYTINHWSPAAGSSFYQEKLGFNCSQIDFYQIDCKWKHILHTPNTHNNKYQSAPTANCLSHNFECVQNKLFTRKKNRSTTELEKFTRVLKLFNRFFIFLAKFQKNVGENLEES
jgi:hypothetical protein